MTKEQWKEEFEKYVYEELVKEDGIIDLDDRTTFHQVQDFIESKVKEAEKRGEDNMKCRVQCLLDDNDDYQMFEWAFKKL